MSATTLNSTNSVPFAWPEDMNLAQRLKWCEHARNVGAGVEITEPWMADNTLFGLTAYYEVSAGMGAVIVEYGIRPNGERFVVR